MQADSVDRMLDQWTRQRPELDTDGLSVVVRIINLNKPLKRQATQALALLGLELWEYDALSVLRRQGRPCQLPATQLARAAALSAGAMTNRIDKLQEKGLVERRADPDDRRGVIVRLTRKGCSRIDKAIKGRLEAANDSVSALTENERSMLASLLRKVTIASQR